MKQMSNKQTAWWVPQAAAPAATMQHGSQKPPPLSPMLLAWGCAQQSIEYLEVVAQPLVLAQDQQGPSGAACSHKQDTRTGC